MISIITVNNIYPLLKDGVLAEKVELVDFMENGFTVLSQKGLYKPGDRVGYIEPDMCIDVSKSGFLKAFEEKLGKIGGVRCRIRAIPFKFYTEDGNYTSTNSKGERVVYSNGILIPLSRMDEVEKLVYKPQEEVVKKQCSNYKPNNDLEQPYPEFIYKTECTNLLKINKEEQSRLLLNKPLYITKKYDGSSCSVISHFLINNESLSVGSRNIIKKITYWSKVERPTVNIFERVLSWFGKKYYQEVLKINDSDPFVKQILDLDIPKKMDDGNYNNIILRGEMVGKSWRGSGNSNNPESKLKNDYVIFGVDLAHPDGSIERMLYPVYRSVAEDMGLSVVKEYRHSKIYTTLNELYMDLDSIFAKEPGIEGVVIRDMDGNFNFKYMNLEYDSRK